VPAYWAGGSDGFDWAFRVVAAFFSIAAVAAWIRSTVRL